MDRILNYLNRLPGTVLVLNAATIWSVTALLTKTVQVNAVLLPCLRGLIAGVILLPFFRPGKLERKPQLWTLGAVAPLMMLLAVFAYRYTTAANAAALYFSAPLWIFLIGTVKRRRADTRVLPSILILVVGILAILSEPNAGSNQLGNLIALTTGVLNAVVCLCLGATKMDQRINYVAFFCWTCFLLIGAFALVTQPQVFLEIPHYDLRTWGMLLLMALTQMVLPYFFFCAALQKIPVQRASILNLLEFILSPVWTLVFLGEIPTAYGVVGWGLILAGLLLNEILTKRAGAGNSQA